IPAYIYDSTQAGGRQRERADRIRRPLSLDAPLGDDPGTDTLSDQIAGEGAGPEAELVDRDVEARRRSLIEAMLSDVVLTPQEREVVERRLLAEEPETLVQLAAEADVTVERVRQIEARALEKLGRSALRLTSRADTVLWSHEGASAA